MAPTRPRSFARALSLALATATATATTACGEPPCEELRPASPLPFDASTEVTHASGSFVGTHGVSLFEQSWRPGTRAPRATLIVVHGLKDHSDRYAAFAEKAAREGVAVYAFDLRGHGRSEGYRVEVGSFDDYVSDLRLFVSRVRAHDLSSPLFVFGHSMGGLIVSELLAHDPPDLRGAIISSAAIEAGASVFTKAGTRTVSALSPGAGVFQLDLDDFSRDPKVVAAAKEDPLIYQPAASAHTAKELLNAIDDFDDRMETIKTPLLVLHGTADKVTPPAGSQHLYNRVASHDRTLKMYHGLYHDLLHEPESWRVSRDILDWIETRSGTR